MKSISYKGSGDNYTSPPSRAAWIEMLTDGKKLTKIESPPSRAAWIEIHV